MFIEYYERHLAIGTRAEAVSMTRTDKRFWNVISISSPTSIPADLRLANRVHILRFEDTENPQDPEAVCVPRAENIVSAIQFEQETAPGGLLVHCEMGLSRSPAIALVLLVRKLWPAPDAVSRACSTLLTVRPISRPNHLIVRLGFGLFMQEDEVRDAMAVISEQSQFIANRQGTSNASRLVSDE